MSDKRVYLYDSTLRDGAQTQGVDFSPADKIAIARELDRLGIDYVEGGWPGANPTDDAFYANPPTLSRAKLSAFGMTRRSGRSAENDPGLQALMVPGIKALTLVGKSWDFQVETALGVSQDENLRMISESIAHAKLRVGEAILDAEHFFDGYRANPEYALKCVKAGYEAGARWIVLCDTNGGSLPHDVERIVREVCKHVPGKNLGVHCHNDSDNAVANSLAAVLAGARQIQGTLNGLGERCGNANLTSIIPNLVLKMGFETGVSASDMTKLTHVSRSLDERLNRAPNRSSPYVGESAFAHKGGLHVSAVEKDPRCYEHIAPELVGNRRHIVVSDQAGRSNILARFREIGAEASFELLARRALEVVPDFFRLTSFRVIDERRWNAKDELITLSEATIKATVKGEELMSVAEGNGPVSALDAALRKVLTPAYPHLSDLKLVDYKVRILNPTAGTKAMTRVMIESSDANGERWATVGVSTNVIDASYNALHDSITYKLLRDGAEA